MKKSHYRKANQILLTRISKISVYYFKPPSEEIR